MNRLWYFVLLALSMIISFSASYRPIVHSQNMANFGCSMPNDTYRFAGSTAPGQVFFVDEPVNITLIMKKNQDQGTVKDFGIDILEIGQRKAEAADGNIAGTSFFAPPDLIFPISAPLPAPIEVTFTDKTEESVVINNLSVPKRGGTFALILTRKKDNLRQFLATVARVPRPNPAATVENTFILGEGNFFNGDKQTLETRASIYERIGIRGMRCEWSWNETADGKKDWSRYDAAMEAAANHNLKIMVTLGGHYPWMYSFAPLQTPAAVYPGWDGNPYSGAADWICRPQLYPRYGTWITEFCQRYWKDGKGGLWGLEHYNEPWEGGGISGWASDTPRYRELMKLIADSARKVSPDIKLFAASSIMNTEDKFYSDGTNEFDKYVDIFTDHYVRPSLSYGPLVAKLHGKQSMETESWMANSEYRLPLGICLFVASGQERVNPWEPSNLFDSVPGYSGMIPTPLITSTAVCNAMTSGKSFEKIALKDRLPWLFQFGKDKDKNALLVMYGQLVGVGAKSPQDLADERPMSQVEAVDGGTITINNRDRLLTFLDLAGNEIYKGQKSVTLPLTYLPTYISCKKGPAAAVERISKGIIKNKRPVEIIPLDFSAQVGTPACKLNVKVHNCMTTELKGTMTVKAPEGMQLKSPVMAIKLAAGETKTLIFDFLTAKVSNSNSYPFSFNVDSNLGSAAYAEILNAAVTPKRTIIVDGSLDEWLDIPGITMVAKTEKVDTAELARRPWLDMRDKLPNGTFGEVKMAWDDKNLYIAARVNDPTIEKNKTRLATIKEDDYFHSAKSDNEEPWKSWLETNKGMDGKTFKEAGRSFAEVPFVYKKQGDFAFYGDRIQMAFDVSDDWHGLTPNTDKVPYGYTAIPDTDYEYSAYLCADGKGELWRLLAPGVPRVHGYPHEPKPAAGKPYIGAVDSSIVIRQEGNVRYYEFAIPRTEIADMKLTAGTSFGFAFIIGNNSGPSINYGEDKAVSKGNGLTMHPYWMASPSCSMRWTLTE
jgi:hypothetical protein